MTRTVARAEGAAGGHEEKARASCWMTRAGGIGEPEKTSGVWSERLSAAGPRGRLMVAMGDGVDLSEGSGGRGVCMYGGAGTGVVRLLRAEGEQSTAEVY